MVELAVGNVGGGQTKVTERVRVGGFGKVMFEARSFARASSQTCKLDPLRSPITIRMPRFHVCSQVVRVQADRIVPLLYLLLRRSACLKPLLPITLVLSRSV
jgi:hypothetical protein